MKKINENLTHAAATQQKENSSESEVMDWRTFIRAVEEYTRLSGVLTSPKGKLVEKERNIPYNIICRLKRGDNERNKEGLFLSLIVFPWSYYFSENTGIPLIDVKLVINGSENLCPNTKDDEVIITVTHNQEKKKETQRPSKGVSYDIHTNSYILNKEGEYVDSDSVIYEIIPYLEKNASLKCTFELLEYVKGIISNMKKFIENAKIDGVIGDLGKGYKTYNLKTKVKNIMGIELPISDDVFENLTNAAATAQNDLTDEADKAIDIRQRCIEIIKEYSNEEWWSKKHYRLDVGAFGLRGRKLFLFPKDGINVSFASITYSVQRDRISMNTNYKYDKNGKIIPSEMETWNFDDFTIEEQNNFYKYLVELTEGKPMNENLTNAAATSDIDLSNTDTYWKCDTLEEFDKVMNSYKSGWKKYFQKVQMAKLPVKDEGSIIYTCRTKNYKCPFPRRVVDKYLDVDSTNVAFQISMWQHGITVFNHPDYADMNTPQGVFTVEYRLDMGVLDNPHRFVEIEGIKMDDEDFNYYRDKYGSWEIRAYSNTKPNFSLAFARHFNCLALSLGKAIKCLPKSVWSEIGNLVVDFKGCGEYNCKTDDEKILELLENHGFYDNWHSFYKEFLHGDVNENLTNAAATSQTDIEKQAENYIDYDLLIKNMIHKLGRHHFAFSVLECAMRRANGTYVESSLFRHTFKDEATNKIQNLVLGELEDRIDGKIYCHWRKDIPNTSIHLLLKEIPLNETEDSLKSEIYEYLLKRFANEPTNENLTNAAATPSFDFDKKKDEVFDTEKMVAEYVNKFGDTYNYKDGRSNSAIMLLRENNSDNKGGLFIRGKAVGFVYYNMEFDDKVTLFCYTVKEFEPSNTKHIDVGSEERIPFNDFTPKEQIEVLRYLQNKYDRLNENLTNAAATAQTEVEIEAENLSLDYDKLIADVVLRDGFMKPGQRLLGLRLTEYLVLKDEKHCQNAWLVPIAPHCFTGRIRITSLDVTCKGRVRFFYNRESIDRKGDVSWETYTASNFIDTFTNEQKRRVYAHILKRENIDASPIKFEIGKDNLFHPILKKKDEI